MKLSQVEAAAARLKGVIHKTPVNSSRTFSELSGSTVYLKCENLQKTGSFKVRGAYNKIASIFETEELTGLVAASAGNHAQGVAYAAKVMGCRASIVMPLATPIAKISATEGYGAKVMLHGECYDESCSFAQELAKKNKERFIHPFDDDEIIAGQGTISLEILRELPTVDVVLVPAGGGGLLAGMAACIKQINPRIRVVGVQAAGADAIVQSFKAKSLVETKKVKTIADGIAVRRPGDRTIELINQYVDDMVTVTDDEIAEAILLLMERTKLVAEPAGAAALAAVLHGRGDIAGKRVVSLLSGGNIDMGFIHRLVEKGLITRGRQIKFSTIMGDVPGNLVRVSSIIAKNGGNVIMIQHDRLHSDLQLNEAILHVACEVSSREHGARLIEELAKAGYKILMESEKE